MRQEIFFFLALFSLGYAASIRSSSDLIILAADDDSTNTNLAADDDSTNTNLAADDDSTNTILTADDDTNTNLPDSDDDEIFVAINTYFEYMEPIINKPDLSKSSINPSEPVLN